MDTIVVVDDDPGIVALLQRILKPHYRVLSADSGVKALGLVGANDVAVVLTDQKMPGMTGVQLARAIHSEDPGLSVVLLTAYSEPQDVIAAINEGEVFRFVSKPWNVGDLLFTLKTAVERARLRRENKSLFTALNRQISAISMVMSVGREVGVSGTAFDVFAHLLRRLPGVIAFDVGAALIEEAPLDDINARSRQRSRQLLLHIECNAAVDERALMRARDRAVALFRETAAQGAEDERAEIVMRVAGGQQTPNHALSEPEALAELFVPLTTHSGQMGLLVLWTSSGRRYGAEDARLLDVLARGTAVLLKQQNEFVDGERRHFQDIMASSTDGAILPQSGAARAISGRFSDDPVDASDSAIHQHGAAFATDARRHVETVRDSSEGLCLAPTDLEPMLKRMCDTQRAHAETVGVKIDLDADGPLVAFADEARVAQVLTNLLTNAFEFARTGSTIRVRASLSSTTPAFVVVSVSDEDPIIPKQALARVFKRFEQGATAALTKARGSGLGLSISPSFSEVHEGFIWVQSKDGLGSTFAVPAERMGESMRELMRPDAQPLLQGTRVLAIDDDQPLAELLRGLLSRFGLKVDVARDGDDALARARRIPFDVILADLRMSEVDGLLLTETLKHDPATRHVPVIVFSVVDQTDVARRAGAAAFIQKPIDLFALLERLGRLKEQRNRGDVPVVLLVEKDEAARKTMEQVLAKLGSRILEVSRFADAQQALDSRRVDLMLIDTVLPDGDGIAAVEKWRAENQQNDIIVLFVADENNTSQKVRAFRAGGDDYLVKPLDALELAARVERALRRREREVASSPTTRLPGGQAIEREVQMRLEAGEPFSLCYFDIDNLKAFNDIYGYAKADAVIRHTGEVLREAVSKAGGPRDFVGHIAGDDFVCVFSAQNAEKVCQLVLSTFDKVIPLYYESEDRKRGYIEAEDRYGARRQFPLMSISVAVLAVEGTKNTTSYAHLSVRAAEVKKRAKSIPGSAMVVVTTRELRATPA